MGLADLVPGISGGSVAFLSGVYPQLLDAIQIFASGKWRSFPWHFAFPLLIGIGLSATLLSMPIHFMLTNHRSIVYSVFLGTMLYSIVLFFKRSPHLDSKGWIALVIGLILTLMLTLALPQTSCHSFAWIIFAGFCGAIAMLAPGISGSYVLCLLGVYPRVIFALSHLSLKESWVILIALAIGNILGLVVASSILKWSFKHFPAVTMALLGGALVGGIPLLMLPLLSSLYLLPFSCLGAYLLYLLTPTVLKTQSA